MRFFCIVVIADLMGCQNIVGGILATNIILQPQELVAVQRKRFDGCQACIAESIQSNFLRQRRDSGQAKNISTVNIGQAAAGKADHVPQHTYGVWAAMVEITFAFGSGLFILLARPNEAHLHQSHRT